ncbi:hypothetical protein SDC9_07432 [bioreactor metagenome]|uniref:Uncharacterized protein n=1 Tax=bioreactor metagenome TaxID=1076179 RepID=A0A644T4J4_9ZZZZ|nr:hypothetical protein [Methanobrevibacter sp.]MEA4956889.1 hypothetical protein [Methanobrevibacter sp.]
MKDCSQCLFWKGFEYCEEEQDTIGFCIKKWEKMNACESCLDDFINIHNFEKKIMNEHKNNLF